MGKNLNTLIYNVLTKLKKDVIKSQPWDFPISWVSK